MSLDQAGALSNAYISGIASVFQSIPIKHPLITAANVLGTTLTTATFAMDNPPAGMSLQAATTMGLVQGLAGGLLASAALPAMIAGFAAAAVIGYGFEYAYDNYPDFKTWADNPIGQTPQAVNDLFTAIGEAVATAVQVSDAAYNEAIDTIQDYTALLSQELGGALSEMLDELPNVELADFKDAFSDVVLDIPAIAADALLQANAITDVPQLFTDILLEVAAEDSISLSIGDSFQSAIEAFRAAFFNPPTKGDPLVLDLDNDGYELIDSRSSAIYFDYNGDSIGERTGWVAPDDGFLALDKNANGAIDDVSELFGNLTMTGFEELATHDETVNGGNADGVINSNDSVYADLRVWQDLNSNGATDSGELQTLSQWGITQISLSATETGQTIAGNELAREAIFSDGQAVDKSIGEVYFNIDFFDNDLVSGAGTVFGTDEALLALPLSRGYGEVISLQKAMETDATLRGLVEDLADFAITANSAQALDDLVTDILLRWTGADQVSPDPNAPIDPQKVAAMEAFFSMDMDDLLNGRSLNSRMTSGMEAAWERLHDMFAARFLFQGPLNSLVPNAHYDFVNDNMQLNASLAQIFNAFEASGWKSEAMSELLYDILNVTGTIDPNVPTPNEAYILFGDYDASWIFSAPNSIVGNLKYIDGATSADTLSGWAGGDVVHGGDGDDTLSTPSSSSSVVVVNGVNTTTTYYATNYHHFMYGDAGNDSITGAYGWVHIFGGAGDDRLISSVDDKDATLHGGADNDTVTSADAHDLLFGGTGSDSLSSGSGNDQLYAGDGNDTLNGGSGNNLLHGGAGNDVLNTSIGLSYLDGGEGNNSFTATGSEVTLIAGSGDDTVSAGDFIGHSTIELDEGNNVMDRTGASSPTGTIAIASGSGADFIRFYAAASTVLSGAGIDTIYGGNGGDSIESGDGNDIADGSDGNDTVRGGSGHDTIWSGSGTDFLYGEAGDDVFYATSIVEVNAGEGNDTVYGYFYEGTSFVDLGAGQNVLDLYGIPANGEYNGSVSIVTGDEGDLVEYRAGFSTVIGGLGNDTISSYIGDDSIAAGDGHDIVDASSGTNTINGGNGDDSITSGNGIDLIYGGEGNDTINSGGGSNIVYGGIGDDSLSFYNGTAYLEDGNDSLTGYGVFTIEAGAGNDTITITYAMANGSSSIDLGSGVNVLAQTGSVSLNANASMTITAGNEGDSITYGRSKATIIGGLGDDTISSGAGADSVMGGDGSDLIDAYTGNNTVYGGAGNDTINSGSGNGSIVYGGVGDDSFTLYGGTAYLEDGNDSLTGYGVFTIAGGAGNDTITITNAMASGSSSIDLGSGVNVLAQTGSVSLNANASMTITAGNEGDSITYGRSKATITGGLSDDTITSGTGADSVLGGDGSDLIGVSSGNNTIYGGEGNDSITAGSGADLIYGDEGNDTITSGGSDTIFGGDGLDAINAYGLVVIEAGAGDDTVTITAAVAAGNGSIDLGTGKNVLAQTGTVSLLSTASITIMAGDEGDSITYGRSKATITGGLGDDTISSGTGADSILGGAGNDLITTSGGVNTLDGGAGSDSITGGSGTDLIFGGDDGDTVNGGSGNDTIDGGNGGDSLDGSFGADSMLGGGGNDTMIGGGTTSSDGADTLYGGDGHDSISGGYNADLLFSDAGHDTLDGGTQNDTLSGGADADVLTSGSGSDYFSFLDLSHSTVTARDVITDFVQSQDKIDLSGLGFTGIQSGAASGTVLGFTSSGGVTIIEADGTDFSIQLTGTIGLLSTDFVF